MVTPTWLLGAAASGKAAASFVLRKYVRADLVDSDRFLDPRMFSLQWDRPAMFLDGSARGRWAEIAWRALLLCVTGVLSAVFVWILAGALARGASLIAVLAVLGMLGLMLAGMLSAQAFLRWMLRNRKRPAGTRVEDLRLR